MREIRLFRGVGHSPACRRVTQLVDLDCMRQFHANENASPTLRPALALDEPGYIFVRL